MVTLQPKDIRHLLVLLADLESGTTRQWWFLEIAAAQFPADSNAGRSSPSRLVSLLTRMLPMLGIRNSLPVLTILGIPGLSVYRPPRHLPDTLQTSLHAIDAARLPCLAILALLTGMNSLLATQQLAVWLIALFTAITLGWRTHWQLKAALTPDQQANQPVREDLPDLEMTLGLTGLLASHGYSLSEAQSLATALRTHPDTALTEPLANCLQLRPLPPVVTAARGWLAAVLGMVCCIAIGLPFLISQGKLQLPAALLINLLLCYATTAGNQMKLVQRLIVTLLVAAGCYGFAWLLRSYS